MKKLFNGSLASKKDARFHGWIFKVPTYPPFVGQDNYLMLRSSSIEPMKMVQLDFKIPIGIGSSMYSFGQFYTHPTNGMLTGAARYC